MNTFAIAGFGVFIGFAAAVAYSLIAGRIPPRWPAPTIWRKDNPASYWFFVGIYSIGAVVAGGIALSHSF
jgi:hypothetical protein